MVHCIAQLFILKSIIPQLQLNELEWLQEWDNYVCIQWQVLVV